MNYALGESDGDGGRLDCSLALSSAAPVLARNPAARRPQLKKGFGKAARLVGEQARRRSHGVTDVPKADIAVLTWDLHIVVLGTMSCVQTLRGNQYGTVTGKQFGHTRVEGTQHDLAKATDDQRPHQWMPEHRCDEFAD